MSVVCHILFFDGTATTHIYKGGSVSSVRSVIKKNQLLISDRDEAFKNYINDVNPLPPNWWTPFDKLRWERKGVEWARNGFTDEFKRKSVALLASSGRSLGQIAEELGISP